MGGVSTDRAKSLARFRAALERGGFAGELEDGLGAREVASTDNSIYQVRPAAIVYPRTAADLNEIVRAARESDLALIARGGNTGTNGQSLGDGVILDFARHMTTVGKLDLSRGLIKVEPGVVLDQLNAVLAEHDLFFPPMVSTASRATIGGMVATDASGKGSRRYGRTSDYIEELDLVLADGNDWRAEPMTMAEANAVAAGTGIVADIHREAARIAVDRADEIARVFPKMNRGLTGYNLQKLYSADHDRFALSNLIAGSEGTLALIKSITLRVVPKPRRTALIVVRYDDFDTALRDVGRLLEADPIAIEIVDDKVLAVAQSDILAADITALLGDAPGHDVQALAYLEFAGDTPDQIDAALAPMMRVLGEPIDGLVDHKRFDEPRAIAKLWSLREKAVGLLGRAGGARQGTAFVEDTAVPPERLADYVAEFRALLDARNLRYGMFGHADVGCLHVRPLLDMKEPESPGLIREVSDQVAALTKKYGGLLWGEHGRGYRGEYASVFFGEGLADELVVLKRAFDPLDMLNPGKIARPDPTAVVIRIDEAPLRGTADATIRPDALAQFDRAVACNGNGACFSWDARDALCPSYKATRDRAQSPKGRAALLRAWARSAECGDGEEHREIEAATAASLATCLACKACTTLCPVNVDIPAMKSRFLARFYERHPRPFRHRLLDRMETALAWARRAPALANVVTSSAIARFALRRGFGLVDLPAIKVASRRLRPPAAYPARLRGLPAEVRARTVVLVEDTFTASFDGAVLTAARGLLSGLGYHLYRLPPRPNGKMLHILGWRDRFACVARDRQRECAELSATGVRLVGLDAATSLMHEQEYREFEQTDVRVIGVEELLARDIADGHLGAAIPPKNRSHRLLSHCTEQALRPGSAAAWVQVLGHFGIAVEAEKTGCCGMAGLFGHEKRNLSISRRLFDLSWRDAVTGTDGEVLATGYSCRSQTERFVGVRPRHPVELLSASLQRRG